MAILLLSTYELGHQPLHLASPLGFLAAAGHPARGIDLAVGPLDEAAVRAARLVAIAVPMHTALRLGKPVAARVRALNPAAHICFFGLYAPLAAGELLGELADSVIGGEYESELVALAGALAAGQPPTARPAVLERLPFVAPARRSLPLLDRYARLQTSAGELVAGYVEASRGCLHLCRHCPIPPVYDGRFFVIPEAVVRADIAAQVAAGARHITLGDPDFLNGPGHAMKVARALHADHPGLTFDVTIKVEHLLAHRALLPELAALGCAFVVTAVESRSDRVLALLDKGHSAADIDVAVDLVRSAGIALRPTLVAFTPWTTLDDYLEVVDWVERRDLIDCVDPVQLAIRLLVPSGSRLLELPEVRAAVGPFDRGRSSHPWQHPDPRMDALAAAVYHLVEAAALAGEDAAQTFARIRAEAFAAAARPAGPPPTHPPRPRAPRLTEAWFC